MIDFETESKGLILSMNHSIYQSDPRVRDFIEWATPLVSGERLLSHQWCSRKWGKWSCESLFDAYRRFKWRFSVILPRKCHPTEGWSFDENVNVLDRLKSMLRVNADKGDTNNFLKAAIAVVQWGGVHRNVRRLHDLGEGALPQLCAAAEQLEPRIANTENLSDVIDMNSGFSKIYSLLVDGLPIYDSRVACGLGFLVRCFCQENGLKKVPEQLALGIPPSRTKTRRDPSADSLQFHKLRWGGEKKYAASNLKAAWLLGPLAGQGLFGELPTGRRLLALQSALFMIGYKTPEQCGPRS